MGREFGPYLGGPFGGHKVYLSPGRNRGPVPHFLRFYAAPVFVGFCSVFGGGFKSRSFLWDCFLAPLFWHHLALFFGGFSLTPFFGVFFAPFVTFFWRQKNPEIQNKNEKKIPTDVPCFLASEIFFIFFTCF